MSVSIDQSKHIEKAYNLPKRNKSIKKDNEITIKMILVRSSIKNIKKSIQNDTVLS